MNCTSTILQGVFPAVLLYVKSYQKFATSSNGEIVADNPTLVIPGLNLCSLSTDSER
jgi:hypothetical protein